MKTIILVLLISLGFGQYYDINADTVSIFDEQRWQLFIESDLPIWMLFEYAEECYNDSIHIWHTELITIHWDSLGNQTSWKDSIIYKEHTTPTFEGFIEWLRK